MLLQFRTERNTYGHCRYLALDTKAETYATEGRGWISKDIPYIKVRDYQDMLERLEVNGWTRVPNM